MLWLASTSSTTPWVFLPLATAAAVTALSFAPALTTFHEPGRGRVQRRADVVWFRRGENWRNVALGCVFSLPTALAVGACTEALYLLAHPWYVRRLVSGHLAKLLRSTS